jgi:hypothetical protein
VYTQAAALVTNVAEAISTYVETHPAQMVALGNAVQFAQQAMSAGCGNGGCVGDGGQTVGPSGDSGQTASPNGFEPNGPKGGRDIGIRISDYAPSNTTAFSGAYDPETGRILMRPSGETTLANGAYPKDLVLRAGGHGTVNQQLVQKFGGDVSRNYAFTVFYDQEVYCPTRSEKKGGGN